MLGTRLQRARKAAGLSLRALGERIGLSHTAIQKYEDGNNVPDSATLLRLASALNVRTEYFFRQEEQRITAQVARAALHKMRDQGRRLPWAESERQLAAYESQS